MSSRSKKSLKCVSLNCQVAQLSADVFFQSNIFQKKNIDVSKSNFIEEKNINVFKINFIEIKNIDNKNIDISLNIPLKFSIKGKKYHLDKSISTVPVSVAVFLISKKLANIISCSS